MQIIGDRHYRSAPGERITFKVGDKDQVGAVTTSAGTGTLPVTIDGGGHKTVAITAGFTGNDGGSVVIEVSSNQGGTDSSRIRQIATVPFRDAIFTID